MRQHRYIRSAKLWLAATALAAIVQAISSVPATAAPVIFGSNAYEFILVTDPFTGNNNSWTNAEAAAQASVFLGANGHLATVTSQQENDFLIGLVSSPGAGFLGAWMGGKAPEGWLTGPENGNAFTYTNWNPIEPNNSGYLYMAIGTTAPGKWFDDSGVQGVPDPNADPVVGYFVEYENVSLVPVPAALPLFASGIGLLGWFGARKRKAAEAGRDD